MSAAPLISVIVAVFNGSSTLQQCINSFVQQTYLNKELIVVDGGSTDGTVDVLRENQDSMAYWVSEPDRGIYNAWNKALDHAKGDWICFLGADDYFWDSNALALMGIHLQTLPAGVRVAYGAIMVVNVDGKAIHAFGGPWGKVRKRFRQLMSIPHQGTMHRRSLFERHGRFDESFRIAGDYELLLRELKSEDAHFVPNITVTAMRQGGGVSSAPGNSWVVLRETRRAQLKNHLYLPGICWCMAIMRLCVRSLLWTIIGERHARKALDLGRRVMGLPPFWTRTR